MYLGFKRLQSCLRCSKTQMFCAVPRCVQCRGFGWRSWQKCGVGSYSEVVSFVAFVCFPIITRVLKELLNQLISAALLVTVGLVSCPKTVRETTYCSSSLCIQ